MKKSQTPERKSLKLPNLNLKLSKYNDIAYNIKIIWNSKNETI